MNWTLIRLDCIRSFAVTYPPFDVMKKVREKGIKCVYGSDAHSMNDVGRGYQHFLRLNEN